MDTAGRRSAGFYDVQVDWDIGCCVFLMRDVSSRVVLVWYGDDGVVYGSIAGLDELSSEVDVMGKDRRTMLKDWLDETGKWDEWISSRDGMVELGVDPWAAHWRAAKVVGYEGTVPKERVTRPAGLPGGVEGSFGSGGIRGDFDWVYRNVSVDGVTISDAPSSGAWGLLEFARNDPRAFYTKWMDICSRQDDRDRVMEGFREDATRRTSDIAEMLRGFREARDGDESTGGVAVAADGVFVGGSQATVGDAIVGDAEVVARRDPGPGGD